MTRFDFTFQEASPLIVYTGLWLEGSPTEDPDAARYDGSFRVTNSSGATATLNFVGTGVSLFGAMRDNHGGYSVDLDHGTLASGNGNIGQQLFQTTLWNASNLSYGQHNVAITNEPSGNAPFLDLDFVKIEREIGQANDTIYHSTLDDTSPFVHYNGTWAPSTTMETNNYNGTSHQTTAANSQLSITFHGSSIELYGLYANAAYTVALDGQAPTPMQGLDVDLAQNMWHPQTLLYLTDGLTESMNHTLVLTATQSNAQRPFSFDYAVVRGTQNYTSDASPFSNADISQPLAASSSNSSSSKSAGAPMALIVGLSVAGAVLLVLAVTAYVLLRRSRRRLESFSETVMAEKTEPYHPAQARHPWFPLDRSRSTSTTTSAWPHPSGEKQTSTGGPQPYQGHSEVGDTSTTIAAPRGSLSATSARPSKDNVSDLSLDRDPRQNFDDSGQPLQLEQDAGVVLEGTSRTLPPAYDLDWDQRR